MQKTLLALSLAAGIGLICSQSAGAVPANAPALKEAADNASSVQLAFYERHTRRGVVKCYHELVVGPYRCHYFRGW
jgi:hypothetical protein